MKACNDAYKALWGTLSIEAAFAGACIGQCTGCMCNCRCSCSGGVMPEIEWEV